MEKKETIQIKDNRFLRSGNRLAPFFDRNSWLIHVIVWGSLLFFPFFLSNRTSESVNWNDYARYFSFLIPMIVVFYVNYVWFIKRFLFTKKTWLFILFNILLMVSMAILTQYLMDAIPHTVEKMRPPRNETPMERYLHFFLMNMGRFLFIMAISVAIKVTTSWYIVEAQRRELERNRSEAELQNLKSQLNPHFLFNTLNNIYSLIAFSPEKAQEAVHELSRLLRYVLYESNQSTITVGKDLAFIRNYVELMRIRLPEHVELKTDIETDSPETSIAPLLFISLIENAFKHGVSNNKPSFIHIKIKTDQSRIECVIRNSYFPKDNQDKSGSGIGLLNLQKRLQLLYPGKYTFTYGQQNDSYVSELCIRLS